MRVFSCRKNDGIFIGDVTLVVVEVCGDKVRLGVEMPQDCVIHRSEIRDATHRAAAPVASAAKDGEAA